VIIAHDLSRRCGDAGLDRPGGGVRHRRRRIDPSHAIVARARSTRRWSGGRASSRRPGRHRRGRSSRGLVDQPRAQALPSSGRSPPAGPQDGGRAAGPAPGSDRGWSSGCWGTWSSGGDPRAAAAGARARPLPSSCSRPAGGAHRGTTWPTAASWKLGHKPVTIRPSSGGDRCLASARRGGAESAMGPGPSATAVAADVPRPAPGTAPARCTATRVMFPGVRGVRAP
jgi:hypothetical protein